jgi:hypothetical protein
VIRFALRIAVLVAGIVFSSCDDTARSPMEEQHPGLKALAALVVSDVSVSAATIARIAEADIAETWVSLPPGSLPGIGSVRIRNLTTGGTPTNPIPLVDGGFDPVPVPARAGDELELGLTDSNGFIRIPVPARRPPSIVRTSPPAGKPDVELDSRPVVIFSEPIDPATLTAGSVRLTSGGTSLRGSAGIEADVPWLLVFVPEFRLQFEGDHELHITTDVRDLQGDALETPHRIPFRTGRARGSASILVTVSTSGADLPDSTYQVYLNEWYHRARAGIAPNGEATLTGVAPGVRSVAMGNIPWNCSVNGDNPVSVAVADGGTAGIAFDITCKGLDGSITGQVTIDGRPVEGSIVALYYVLPPVGHSSSEHRFKRTTESGGGFAIEGLIEGEYGLTASSVGMTCPPQVIRIAGDEAVSAAVECVPEQEPGIGRIHVANADGSGAARIGTGHNPAWSPDSRLIVFDRENQIRVMLADGTAEIALSAGFHPAWSPDGGKIAFAEPGGISIMNSDGSAVRRLISLSGLALGPGLYADNPRMPAWSPDGRYIAFAIDYCCDEIFTYVRMIDSSGKLVSFPQPNAVYFPVGEPAWSPSGADIAYIGGYPRNGSRWPPPWTAGALLTVDLNGRVTRLHQYCDFDYCSLTFPRYAYVGRPAWSADGAALAFTSSVQSSPWARYPHPLSIHLVSREGGAPRLLLENASEPAFSPDGMRIAFVRRPG